MSSRFKEVAEATSELLAFMQAQVAERKADIRARGSAGRDAFSMLVEASEKEEEKYKMDDSEIVRIDNFCLESDDTLPHSHRLEMSSSCCLRGMVRVSLFICDQNLNEYHPETTARSLSATIGFLALYDDLQEEIYQQIISVVGQERDPVSTRGCLSYLSV